MTALGFGFVAAYFVAFAFWRLRGLLVVAAAAIPFDDSAAVILGSSAFSPFYLGMLLFLPLAAVAAWRESLRLSRVGLPLALWLWVAGITLVGPMAFAGMHVFASGVGLDAQINNLAELTYSSSNAAQMIYLTLNLGFVLLAFPHRQLLPKLAVVAAIVGTVVGAAALALGDAFPHLFFDNDPRALLVPTPRLRAQFSEPSHLGTFALAALALFFCLAISRRGIWRAAFTALACVDALLIIESQAATALVGAALLVVSFPVIWILLQLRSGRPIFIPLPAFWIAVAGGVVAVFAAPRVLDFINEIIVYKQTATTASVSTRSATNAHAWTLFQDTVALGVGLGGNRASSMAFMLLSTVGIVGTALFLVMAYKSIAGSLADPARFASGVALIAFLGAALVSYADFVSPLMWLLIAIGWHAYSERSAREGQFGRLLRPGSPVGATTNR